MTLEKYNSEIHHRKSIRLKEYNYSLEGAYFITICTYKHKYLFGEIKNGKMNLNIFGKIVRNEWEKTGKIRRNIEIDKYVIMPNHIHGIIIINRRGTLQRAPTYEQFGKPTSDSIPTIVRLFKSSVTKQINILRKTKGIPVWQRNYYEHIIRDENDYLRIAEYITNNLLKWEIDKYFKEA